MFSPTLIRRYTPPTCSLEVVAKTSALSQWTGNPVIKELQFELNLDDPRLVTEQKIKLTGDRQQLEDLAAAVTDYVQNFLQQTNPVFDFAPTQNIYTYQIPGGSNLATIARPQLETKGLLSHSLHLGRLANDISGQTIQLSATQLYDLANALESYSADMVALPALTSNQNRKTVIRWGAIAASLLLAVGISKTVLQLQQPQTESAVADLESAAPNATDLGVPVVPPDLHASYTFAPVPEAEDPALTAEKADPTQVNLEAIASAPPAPRPVAPPPSPRPAPLDNGSVAPAPRATSFSGDIAGSSASPENVGESLARVQLQELATTAAEDSAALPSGDRLSQIKRYFQDQWQPPEGLGETLEYRLAVTPDGTLQQVIPLGKAAELYQPELPYLSPGQLLTTRTTRTTQTVRLVLDIDGTVQTFTETIQP